MDIERGKISFFSAASVIFLSSAMVIHVLDIPIILEAAGRDAWISIMIAAPVYIFWLVLLTKFIKFLNGEPLIDWVRRSWGKVGYSLFTVAVLCVLLFNLLHTLKDTMIWTSSTYLQDTPGLVILYSILLLSLIIALSGLQSLSVTAAILLPIVTFLGFFVAFGNQKYKDLSLLLPILENGLQPPLLGAFYALASLFDSLLIVFIAHPLKKKISYKKTIGLGLYLIMIFTGPIIGGITEFGVVEASAQRYSVFDQWKILSIGQFLQHLDFLSIFQWLSGSVIRVAFLLYIMTKLLSINTKTQKTRFAFISVILAGLSALITWQSDTSLTILRDYYFPIYAVFIFVITVAFGVTCLLTRHKNNTSSPFNSREQSNQGGDESNGKEEQERNK